MCEYMRLSAHYVQNENLTGRAAGGRITLQPRDVPIRSVTALAYGWDPSCLVADTLPDNSMWVENGRLVSFRPGGGIQQFTGPAIQFGPGPYPQGRIFVQWSYVAGFPSTYLSSSCAAAASSVTLDDPTGVLPGDTLRIYRRGGDGSRRGQSEALTVWPAPTSRRSLPVAADPR